MQIIHLSHLCSNNDLLLLGAYYILPLIFTVSTITLKSCIVKLNPKSGLSDLEQFA